MFTLGPISFSATGFSLGEKLLNLISANLNSGKTKKLRQGVTGAQRALCHKRRTLELTELMETVARNDRIGENNARHD